MAEIRTHWVSIWSVVSAHPWSTIGCSVVRRRCHSTAGTPVQQNIADHIQLWWRTHLKQSTCRHNIYYRDPLQQQSHRRLHDDYNCRDHHKNTEWVRVMRSYHSCVRLQLKQTSALSFSLVFDLNPAVYITKHPAQACALCYFTMRAKIFVMCSRVWCMMYWYKLMQLCT